ncbi:MAG: SHOCT domain-containing protein [Planctomycetes bacterium]|nr:SHOCT domain-containing protein [Planctomycetota bacterium]
MIGRSLPPGGNLVWWSCTLAQTNQGGPENNGHMDGYGHMMNYWGAGVAMWLFFIVIVVVIVYFLVRASGASAATRTPTDTPLDILKKRYARGEITKEQFDEIKKDL